MEGRKGRIVRSLRLRLCVVLSVIGILFTAVLCYRAYNINLENTKVYVDEELSQIARVIVTYKMLIPKSWQGPRIVNGRVVLPHRPQINQRGRMMNQSSSMMPEPSLADLFDKHQDIIIAPLFGQPGETFYLPLGVDDGFYTVMINDQRVRAFVATTQDNIRFVVARPLAIIEDLISRSQWASFARFTIMILLLVPIVVFVVSLMFAAVNRMALEVYRRQENDLRPLEGKVPSELDVFISSLNRLFSRTAESIKNERRFIADAAHEMRTPLTALSLQAETFPEEGLPDKAREKLGELRKAISRQRDLTNKLLTLARSQVHSVHIEKTNFAVKDLFVEIIEELGSLADEGNIDLGVEGEVDCVLCSDLSTVRTIMTNLVSNALKYCGRNGQVDLKCIDTEEMIYLVVQDNGPGIDKEELPHVFEPFYRVGGDSSKITGTGLGLAIVASSCQLLGAQIKLENAQPHGLIAKVGFLKHERV